MPRILLVEDNEMNRDMLSRRLGRRGFEVALAVDGLQGLIAARSSSFDLILMDLSLPGIDGWEAIRRLKADPETRSTPIIALTAHAMAGDRERAVDAGCDDYDIKPIEFARLVAKIEGLLQRREPLPIPDKLTYVVCDARRIANNVLLDLMAPTTRIRSRIELLTLDAGEQGRTDLIDGLRSIGNLVAGAITALELAQSRFSDPDRPVDLAALVPTVLASAHEIIRLCDRLEESSSQTSVWTDFLVQLSEIRKDAALMIAIVWKATADPCRTPC